MPLLSSFLQLNRKEAADFLTLLGQMRNQTPEIGLSIGHDRQQGANITQTLETKEEMAEAMRRWEIIKPTLRGEPITDRADNSHAPELDS